MTTTTVFGMNFMKASFQATAGFPANRAVDASGQLGSALAAWPDADQLEERRLCC
jgi:hypothetical protein